MSITFDVIDTACEQSNQSFFVPQISMSSKSTTQYAVLHGYSEFIASTPPKKYRKATVSGFAERVGFTMEQTPRQCAGAKYTWSGFGEYDLQGVQTASYSKKLYAQCTNQYWPPTPLQTTPFAISPCPNTTFCNFVGYCWPDDPNSCPVCDPNIVNWPLIADQTTNVLALDLRAFLIPPNTAVITSTSYAVNGQVLGFCAIASPPFNATFTGISYPVTVGADTYQAQAVITDPPLAFPVVLLNGVVGQYINFADASNFSAVLSEEYTDADALANAQVVVGTSTTAQTTPRTTGFTSVYTSVVFTLFMSNLVAGKDYLVQVDLWEKGPNNFSTHTPKQYGFTASDTTHTITDVVPTPVDFHTITVQKPLITFAPL